MWVDAIIDPSKAQDAPRHFFTRCIEGNRDMQVTGTASVQPAPIPPNISIEPRSWMDLQVASVKVPSTQYQIFPTSTDRRAANRSSFVRAAKDFESSIGDAVRYSRKYRGAIGVMQAADGFHWLVPLGVRDSEDRNVAVHLNRGPFDKESSSTPKLSFERNDSALQAIVEGADWIDFRSENDIATRPGEYSFRVNDVLDGDYWLRPRVVLDNALPGEGHASLRDALAQASKASTGKEGALAIVAEKDRYFARPIAERHADGALTPVVLEGSQLRSDDPDAASIASVKVRNRDPRIQALVDGSFIHVFKE